MRLTSKSQRILLIALLASSLVLVVLIATDWLPILRGPAPETSEWYWPYSLRPFTRWWPTAIAAFFFWLAAAWWLSPETSNRPRNVFALLTLVVASFLLQLAFIYADRANTAAEIIDRTLSNQASGFFEPAAEIEDMTAALSSYPQQMPQFASEHAQTHPPGIIVANWLTIRALSRWPALSEFTARFIRPLRCTDLWLLDRPPEFAAALAVWSLLPLIAAAICIVPAYFLARLFLHGPSRRLAAILVATIPALLLFAPKSVQFYALLVLFLFWIFQSALQNHSYWRFLFAGVLTSSMTYLSLGNAILLPFLVVYAGLYQWFIIERQQETFLAKKEWISFLKEMLIFVTGALSLWLINWLIWKVPPWEIARVGLQQHHNLVTQFRRYDWWVIWNLIDLVLFSGWPLFLGFMGSILVVIHAWRQKNKRTVSILAICLLLLIVTLNISGSTRGEVGRIWLFLMPLLAYPAAHFWAAALPGRRNAWLIIALQLLFVISIGLSWRSVRAVIVIAQTPDMPAISPSHELNISFAEQPFLLEAYTLQSDKLLPGETLELTLFWQANAPAQRPYTVFNHLVDTEGNLVAQQDDWPVEGRWPPTCWKRGDFITDSYRIVLPDDLPVGTYSLYTGLYDAQSGLRVALQNGDDTVQISEITVITP